MSSDSLTIVVWPQTCENIQSSPFQKWKTKYWIQFEQQRYHAREIREIREHQYVNEKSQLHQLKPFLDDNGILKVGGRLKNSSIPESAKYPIIICKESHLAKLYISHVHELLLHSGVNQVLVEIRQKFWITHSRNLVKRIIHHCVICQK